MLKKYLTYIEWGLAALVVSIAVVAWAGFRNWQLTGLTNYDVFPLFGLLAFSLMWCHYIIGGVKIVGNISGTDTNTRFFEVTAAVVLGSLLLHPGLLIWQLWRDGFGLPPASYLNNYVAPSLAWAAYLGTVSWVAFMAFELRRWYRDKRWWKYVQFANDIAIWAIFIHGLKLGADVAAPWLLYVWYGYGVLLAAAFALIYYKKLAQNH